jgi:peptidoglycan/LPS O-acetylase OafA/YrhL
VSFSLYLDHFPLLLLYGTLLPRQPVAIALLILASVALLGVLFERRKHLLRRWLSRLVGATPLAPRLAR